MRNFYPFGNLFSRLCFSTLIIIGLFANNASAQVNQYVGPTSVYATQTATYSYTRSSAIGSFALTVTNASIVSQYVGSDPNTAYATVTWGAGSSGILTFYSGATSLGALNVTVTGCPTLSAPATPIASPSTVCHNSTSALTTTVSSPVNNIQWYSASSGGTLVGTGVSINVTVASTTTYYAASYITNTGCHSTGRTAVTVTTNANTAPGYPTGYIPVTIYGHGSAQLVISPPSGSAVTKWYDAPTGGSLLATGSNIFTTPDVSTNTSFYASNYLASTGCESKRVELPVVVSATITASKIIRENIRVAAVTTDAQVNTLTDVQKSTVNTYYDGFGRAAQTIAVRASAPTLSATVADIISPADYDAYGRPYKSYLPYAQAGSTAGDYQPNFPSSQLSFYATTGDKVANDVNPYSTARYEDSPMARPLEVGSVGAGFQVGSGHTKTVSYSFNTAAEAIRKFNSDGSSSGSFTANQLSKTKVTDANGNIDISYGDPLGRTVAVKKQISASGYADTYYIYDDLNQVKYILPPGGVEYLKTHSWTVDQAFLDQQCYQFMYDNKGRVTQKKSPNQSWSYYVYDRVNRLVLIQDGNLRPSHKWNFIKYDGAGRAVMTGTYKNTVDTSLLLITQLVDAQYAPDTTPYFETRGTTSSNHGYTNLCFPTGNQDLTPLDIRSVNYYDDYDLNNDGADDFPYLIRSLPGEGTPETMSIGRATVSKTLRLEGSDWLYTYVYYDKYGRVIQTQKNNHLSLTPDNVTTMVYDFEKLLLTYTEHNVSPNPLIIVQQKYYYTDQGRLNYITHNTGTGFLNPLNEKTLAKYEYNELGQVVDKKLHSDYGSSSFLQSVDFRYSVKGALLSINNAQLSADGVSNDEADDFFGMNLAYEGVDASLGNSPQYDGKVSALKWKGPFAGNSSAGQRSYKYQYDNSDQMLSATFQKFDGTSWGAEAGSQSEAVTYDFNGNIATIQRNQLKHGLGVSTTVPNVTAVAEQIDNLTHTYASPNQLSKVEDSVPAATGTADFKNNVNVTTEYTYDAVGNITSDLNKGISSITYNDIGKAKKMTFSSGNTVEYAYDAAGTKLSMTAKVGATTTITNYIDGFVYNGTTLDYFATSEGRVVKHPSDFEYQYAIGDHQGNTRVMFSANDVVPTAVTASFESPDVQSDFDKYPGGSMIHGTNNHTSAGAGHSMYLNGGYTATIGLAKAFQVYPGDQIKAEGYAMFVDSTATGGSPALTDFAFKLVAAFGLPQPALGETGTPAAALKSFGGFEANGYKDGDGGPTDNSAFLTILLFDNKFQFLDVAYVSATTKNAWEYLSKTYTVREPGFAFVYASNESPTLSNVYFDDLNYTHTPTRVIQSNEYYPFGLKTNVSWTRLSNSNNFLYNQGSELNDVSGLYDLPYRNYDAALGRFFQMDPMALQTASMSSYHYAGNSPVNINDPSGLSYPGFTTGGLSTLSPISPYFDWFSDWPIFGGGADRSKAGGAGDNNTNGRYDDYSDQQLKKAIEEGDLDAAAYAVNKWGGGAVTGHLSYCGACGVLVKSEMVVDPKTGFFNHISYFSGEYYWDNDVQSARQEDEPNGFVKALIFINEFNPVANAWDAVSGYLTGKDRFGHPISTGMSTLKAASVIPIGKLAGVAGKGLKFFSSLTDKFGKGYSSVAVAQGPYLGIELGQKLNSISAGAWSKVYEAGLLDGSKVEVHYFYNATTGQYANPFIKMGEWGSKAFDSLK